MNNSKDLHKEFVRLGSMRHKLKNQMLFILPEIYESGIYKKYSASIYEYAAKFGDLSKTSVQLRLRLEPNLQNKPHLREAIGEVGVNKVAMIAKIATPETEEIFADKIKNMNKKAVQTLAKELREKKNTDKISAQSIFQCCAAPEKVRIELDEEMTFLFLKLKNKFGKNLSNKEVMRIVLERAVKEEFGIEKKQEKEQAREQAHKITESLTGQTLTEETKNCEVGRYIPIAKRREEIQKTNGKCAYPNCNRPAEIFHHPERFSHTKNHNSIKPLCKPHHEFAHNSLISSEKSQPKDWKLTINNPLCETDQLFQKYRQKAMQ